MDGDIVRLIDADVLREKMFHDSFETDTGMQKWDSGLWIRYKIFENNLEETPTVDAVPVVRCKDCIHWFFCRDPLNRDPDDFCSDGEKE